MRAVVLSHYGGPSALRLQDVPEPTAGPTELLVDTYAAGVIYPDVLRTYGRYQVKPELPFVMGAEIAGLVRSAPTGSTFRPGDRIAAMSNLGGFAEVAVVQEENTFHLPDAVSFTAGAALLTNYLTMHLALWRRARLTRGDVVLIHGAAGGLGTASIQVARCRGARVIAVVSTEAKAEVAREAGATDVVLAEGFLESVRTLTEGRGVDVVVDPVGGPRFTDSIRCLAEDGRLLVLGFADGEIPTVRVNRLLLGNVDLIGVQWGAYSRARRGFLQQQWTELLPHVVSGELSPLVSRTYSLEKCGEAVADLDERRSVGRVMIAVRNGGIDEVNSAVLARGHSPDGS